MSKELENIFTIIYEFTWETVAGFLGFFIKKVFFRNYITSVLSLGVITFLIIDNNVLTIIQEATK